MCIGLRESERECEKDQSVAACSGPDIGSNRRSPCCSEWLGHTNMHILLFQKLPNFSQSLCLVLYFYQYSWGISLLRALVRTQHAESVIAAVLVGVQSFPLQLAAGTENLSRCFFAISIFSAVKCLVQVFFFFFKILFIFREGKRRRETSLCGCLLRALH